MNDRSEVLRQSKEKPFVVTFVELGNYEDLTDDFEEFSHAEEKALALIKEAEENNVPYFCSISERIKVWSKE